LETRAAGRTGFPSLQFLDKQVDGFGSDAKLVLADTGDLALVVDG
jgi:hypothetical protein